MRSSKTFFALLLALALIGFTGGSSLLMADQNDPPHQTHLTHARGPSIFLDKYECERCHDGSPAWTNVNTNACNTCHSPGGAFDGVEMAKANWGCLSTNEAGGILIIRPASLLVLLT